jgi:uncharacterized protein (DUF433 family)
MRGHAIIDVGDHSLTGDQVVGRALLLDLLAPFESDGITGPDLRKPRASLRIVPAKLSGEPHVAGTRLESRAVAALVERGFSLDHVASLYPFATPPALADCVDLERQLAANLRSRAA